MVWWVKKDDERIQIVRLKLVCAVGLRAVQERLRRNKERTQVRLSKAEESQQIVCRVELMIKEELGTEVDSI